MFKNVYKEDGYLIQEMNNGTIIKTVISEEIEVEDKPQEQTPTLEEMQMQTLLNTEYLVIMSELTNI